MRRMLFILLALLSVGVVSAQDTKPASIGFRVKQLHQAPGQAQSDVVVVVRDGVVAVHTGPADVRTAMGLPSDFEIVDLPEGVVVPAFVLAHSRTLAQVADPEESLMPATVAADAFDPFDDRRAVVRGGVTTAYLSPGLARLVAGQGSVVRLAGTEVGGHVLVRHASLRFALTDSVRSAPNVFNPPLLPSLDDPIPGAEIQPGKTRAGAMDALRGLLRRAAAEGRDAAKAPDVDAMDLRPIARALAGEFPIRIAADRSADVAAAIELAREFKFKLVIEGGNEAWRHAADLASIGASVVLRAVAVPPVVGNDLAPVTFESGEGRRSAAATLIAAGVPVAIVPPFVGEEGEVLFHATRLLGPGFGTAEALASVTTSAARIVGLPEGTGTIAAGKSAEFVVYGRNPFSTHERPLFVFSAGRLVHRAKDKGDVVAITVGRVHTCDGDPIDGATVVVEDGKIRAVGKHVSVPAGAKWIHRPDAVVVPGFVDGGTQVGLRAYASAGEGGLVLGPKFGAVGTEAPLVENFDRDLPDLRAAAHAGVTSAALTPGFGKLVAGGQAVVKTGGGKDSVIAKSAGVVIDLAGNAGGAPLAKQLDGFVESAKKYHESWSSYESSLAEWKRTGKASAPKAPESRSLGTVTAPKGKDPITGTWTGEIKMGRSPRPLPFTMSAKLEGTKVTGELTMTMGGRRGGGQPRALPFEGTFEGGKLKIEAAQEQMTVTVEATVGRDVMEGTVKLGPIGDATFSASRGESDAAASSGGTPQDSKPAEGAATKAADDGRPKPPAKNDNGEAWRAIVAGKAAVFVHITAEAQVDAVVESLRGKHDLKVVALGTTALKQGLQRLAAAGVAFGTSGEMLTEDGMPESAADKAFRAKMPVVFRTGASGDVRDLYGIAEIAVREGVDPEDALRMITRQPARFLGVLDRVGSIERGKDADLVILSGEPFTPGARVLMTMIDGKILETEGSR